MDANRLTEWLKSVGGVPTALITAIAAFGLLYVAITNHLAPVITFLGNLVGLSEVAAQRAAQVGALLLLLPILWFVWRSWRRFSTASRLERPEAFTLVATTPESLIGREEDLRQLQHSVLHHRIVLLDGESGCGKSALVAAGLVPRLQASDGLLPVLVRDWGGDWVRGPTASALGALFEGLSSEQRTLLDWASAPDLAADAKTLGAELETRLVAVAEKLHRRPLLIADQFDDYQAQHRECFLDADGNWLTPDALSHANPFWTLVRGRIAADALHLLAMTRADTASGLSCIQFLDSARTAVRQLPRVEADYLRPLLAGVAPDDAKPLIVSQPDGGWNELRERLEMQLRVQGSILMQQVRTVLLGLRQLPVLTVRAYRRAGEMRGVETLAVARAVRRAGEAVGGGETGQRIARNMLGAMVFWRAEPATKGTAPTARRAAGHCRRREARPRGIEDPAAGGGGATGRGHHK